VHKICMHLSQMLMYTQQRSNFNMLVGSLPLPGSLFGLRSEGGASASRESPQGGGAAAGKEAEAAFTWRAGDPGSIQSIMDNHLTRSLPMFLRHVGHAASMGPAGPSSSSWAARRKPQFKLLDHKCLPAHVAGALAGLGRFWNPHLVPQHARVRTKQQLFLPSEDLLLAIGMRRYGCNYLQIVHELLPCKTRQQVRNRQKNARARNSSDVIIATKEATNAALTAEEIGLIMKGLERFGSQGNKWELISRTLLPSRPAAVICRLWEELARTVQIPTVRTGPRDAVADQSQAELPGLAAHPGEFVRLMESEGLELPADVARGGGADAGDLQMGPRQSVAVEGRPRTPGPQGPPGGPASQPRSAPRRSHGLKGHTTFEREELDGSDDECAGLPANPPQKRPAAAAAAAPRPTPVGEGRLGGAGLQVEREELSDSEEDEAGAAGLSNRGGGSGFEREQLIDSDSD